MIVGSLERVAVQLLSLLALPVFLTLRIKVHDLEEDRGGGIGQRPSPAGTAPTPFADNTLLITAEGKVRVAVTVEVTLE